MLLYVLHLLSLPLTRVGMNVTTVDSVEHVYKTETLLLISEKRHESIWKYHDLRRMLSSWNGSMFAFHAVFSKRWIAMAWRCVVQAHAITVQTTRYTIDVWYSIIIQYFAEKTNRWSDTIIAYFHRTRVITSIETGILWSS